MLSTFFPIFIIIIVIAAIVLFTYLIPVPLWIAAWSSGAYVGLANLIGMRFRRVPPHIIVNARISAVKAGININTNDLEALYLAGGHVGSVVAALISADKAKIKMDFNIASGIDLAGRNVLEAVRMSVIPKIIETPVVSAVAKDGIQVMAKSRVTVRANMERLVGGAGEDTIVARVGEGIVTTIGSAPSYKDMLENPDSISRTVLAKGLDSGTAFEILSIDIGDVDVGENIGARLQTMQALADKEIAQAKAESRRALAVAAEQEMKARVQEMRARVTEAEAQVPLAIAEAFRAGNLGVMDYYNIKNIMADTKMRDSISGISPQKPLGAKEPSPPIKPKDKSED
ncbi:MAG: flotillin-like protein FloA [bacterium]